jgi:opacity protein-like surface antigen
MFQLRTAAVLALTLAFAPAALAQTTTPPPAPTEQQPTFQPLPPDSEGFTITPFLGLGFAGDYENTPTSFGAAVGYGWDERVSVEGELFFTPGAEQDDVLEFDTSVTSLAANVLYHFTAEDFTPYVTLGLGYMFADAEIEDVTPIVDDDTEGAFAWNWGAGIKSAMSDRFGLRADLRYFNASDLVPDHWRLYGGVVFRNVGR